MYFTCAAGFLPYAGIAFEPLCAADAPQHLQSPQISLRPEDFRQQITPYTLSWPVAPLVFLKLTTNSCHNYAPLTPSFSGSLRLMVGLFPSGPHFRSSQMARLDTTKPPAAPAPKPASAAQTNPPKPSQKPVFTDYASL